MTYERFQSPSFSTAKEVVGVEGGSVVCTKKAWLVGRVGVGRLLYALFLTIVLIITTSSHNIPIILGYMCILVL